MNTNMPKTMNWHYEMFDLSILKLRSNQGCIFFNKFEKIPSFLLKIFPKFYYRKEEKTSLGKLFKFFLYFVCLKNKIFLIFWSFFTRLLSNIDFICLKNKIFLIFWSLFHRIIFKHWFCQNISDFLIIISPDYCQTLILSVWKKKKSWFSNNFFTR